MDFLNVQANIKAVETTSFRDFYRYFQLSESDF